MASLRRALISANRALKSTQTLLRPQYSYGLVQRSYSTDNTSNLNIDLSNEESKRRLFNRLLYRSKQRGFLELDLVLGKWVEDHIHSMDENEIKALVDVLDLENPDLWKWLSGQEQPPEALKNNPVFTAVQNRIMKNLDSYAAPETRATPGNPWVRGWDDIKKGMSAHVMTFEVGVELEDAKWNAPVYCFGEASAAQLERNSKTSLVEVERPIKPSDYSHGRLVRGVLDAQMIALDMCF